MTHRAFAVSRRGLAVSQAVSQPQNLPKQFPLHRDLGHLEVGVAAMAHDLSFNLVQLLSQARQ